VRWGSVLRLAALALLWGSNFLWIKIALRGFSPVQLTLVRLALGAVVLLAVVYALRLPGIRGRRLWLHLAVAAFFANALPYTLFGVGEQYVASNVAGVLNATTPLWTLAVGLAVRHERRLIPSQLAGLLLGFAGTVAILSPWRSSDALHLGGALACLAAAASYGVSYVYMDLFLAGRGIPPLALSAYQLVAATALLAAATPLSGFPEFHARPDVVVAVVILGLLGTGIAYVLNYRLITDEGSIAASSVTYLIPTVSVVLGAAVLDESVTVSMLLGTSVVLGGVAIVLNLHASERGNARPDETGSNRCA
jgi:drug/metabolite transporter (DMT)-like permease